MIRDDTTEVNNIESLDVLGEGATIRAEAFRQFNRGKRDLGSMAMDSLITGDDRYFIPNVRHAMKRWYMNKNPGSQHESIDSHQSVSPRNKYMYSCT